MDADERRAARDRLRLRILRRLVAEPGAWSLGPMQGQVGRARQFQIQEVRADVFVIWFATMLVATLTAVVDFRNGTLTGFTGDAYQTKPVTGTFCTL